jgi:adenine-specific DNA-methyltransferase
VISVYHTKYFAHEPTRRCPPDSVEELAGQIQIKALEAQRNRKRRSLFDAQDQVDKQREELIAVIEGKLNPTTPLQPLFMLRRTLS